MGTNYYLTKKCNACNHEEKIHIGKSSAGWCFSLHVYLDGKEIGDETVIIKSLDDWKIWFEKTDWKIVDEYRSNIFPSEMIEIITNRSYIPKKDLWNSYKSWEDFYDKNSAVPGPNNLLRAKISKDHCIGHGEGTWDLIVGDFF